MGNQRLIILTGLFAALTGIGAYLKIPLPNVPVTLQTFFVYLSANLLGAYYGGLSQIIYLLIGLIGIPVFAYGGGPGYFVQPTFGYLLSYPISAFVIGAVLKYFRIEHGKSFQKESCLFLKVFFANFIGLFIIFSVGLGYLYLNLHFNLYLKYDQFASSKILEWDNLFRTTLFVFMPIDLIKVFLATMVTTKLFQKYNFLKFPQIQRA